MVKQKIKNITEADFSLYGRVVTAFDWSAAQSVMKQTPVPAMVTYIPSVAALEELPLAGALQDRFYGGLPIQIGYCNGHNKQLNAVEYHRDSEVNFAVTDLVLMVGRQQDITADYKYDTAQIELFFVPAGTMLELYATTLHYAPCHTDPAGFQCVVVLPRGTNETRPNGAVIGAEDRLLFARNKWLLGHPQGGLPKEACLGLIGENITI